MIMRDFVIGGVVVPGLLLAMLLAFAASLVLRNVFALVGLYRAVWHPALFDLAVYVLLLWGIAELSHWVSP
ncbi:DUF1656 domain-containing protein [Mesorhizobium sp. KR1-2]|uniref:DUF1656 domain-containing protein n=1 Tax=Mesorhizobium sp. KR1-2 TaxID=3156609 RepID=UPI0032B5CB7C